MEDQEIIDSYGGLDNTPSYLVRLRPVLTINKDRIVVAQDGLPMGSDYTLTIELISPNGTETINNTLIAGNLSVIGIVAQRAVSNQLSADSSELNAESLLFQETNHYIDRWNQAEDELASLLHLSVTRPLPTVVTLAGMIDVTYLLDMPHGFTWKGVFIDADLRAVEAVSGQQSATSGQQTAESSERVKLFTQLSSLQGSILENRIFEDDFQVQSISTAKVIQMSSQQAGNSQQSANNQQSAVSGQLFAIDKTNIDAVLPTLDIDDNIKEDIVNAVNQNLVVRLPSADSSPLTAITYQDWSGLGYLKENVETGESGWMLSGSIAGGMTAWDIDRWNAIIAGTLSNSYSEPANYDPASAQYIQKLTEGDMQYGTAGAGLELPLRVKVTDADKVAVAGVSVTFTVKAGGGTFDNMTSSVTVSTNASGIASVPFILGKYTKTNPTFVADDEDTYYTQAGENIIDAALPSGANLTMPFTALGLPDAAVHLTPLHGNDTWGLQLSFAGFVSAAVEDQYNNPISNATVTFSVADPVQTPGYQCAWTTIDTTHKTYFTETGLACIKNSPTWGTCGDTNKQELAVITSPYGASAQVILGGMDGANYTVTAIASSLSATFEIYTYELITDSADPCDGTDDPYRALMTNYAYTADQYGNNINAGKTGTTIPVTASMYYDLEKWEMKDVACGSGTCSKVVGNRQWETSTDFTNSSMTFGTTAGTPQDGGVFTSNYQLQAGKNEIPIKGTGTITVRNTTLSCPNGCTTADELLTQTGMATMIVYGVTVQTQPVPVLFVDEGGYLVSNQTITYTIEPLSSDYKAMTAYTFIYKDGGIVAQIPTETKGTGMAIISKGFQFDVNSIYEAEVVLNYGTGVEIRSDKVPMLTASLDLDIDSDNNSAVQSNGIQADPSGNKNEEEVEDYAGFPGKVVRVNSADTNQNGVPDFADGIDLFDNQGTSASYPFAPLLFKVSGSFDRAKASIRFSYVESDPSAITRTGNSSDGYIYTAAPGNIRLWTRNGPESRLVASIKNNGNYVKPGEEYSLQDLGLGSNNNTLRLFVEGVAASMSLGDQRIMIEIDPDGNGPQSYMAADAVRVTVDGTSLIPDYNHDRTIDDKDKERALSHDIYYFWVNDDNDTGETEGDDIPGDSSQIDTLTCSDNALDTTCDGINKLDANNAHVDGVRDLVDFFPVFLDIKGLIEAFDPGSYTYKLKSEDSSLRFAFSELTKDNAGDYLTGSDTSLEPALSLGGAETFKITNEGITLNNHSADPEFLKKIKEDEMGIILLEGRKASDKPLVLAVYDNSNNAEVFSTSLKLSLAGVEQMFRHKNLVEDGGGPTPTDSEKDRWLDQEPGKCPDVECLGANPDSNVNFVFLHGYNVNPQQARGWHAEMFKRMYWSGSKTKFWGVTWNGSDTQTMGVTRNYHINVRHAFATAPKLAEFLLLDVRGDITIAAHSLGNMVVASAISDYGANVKNNLMIDAAVAMEAYDGAATISVDMKHPKWEGYNENLWASEWHTLFDAGDARSKLSWRNRFGNRPGGAAYFNFYSTGEEVLAAHPYASMPGIEEMGLGLDENSWWNSIAQLLGWNNSSSAAGTYSWALQEKLKGRMLFGAVLGSNYGGWGFNHDYDVQDNNSTDPDAKITMPNEQANLLGMSELKTKPFFIKGSQDNDLFTDSALSADYFNINQSQERIDKYARLLAEALPALTLPAGANIVQRAFGAPDKFNFNMQDMQVNGWPYPGSRNNTSWLHSDMKDMAYVYTHALLDKFVKIMEGVSQ